MWELPVLIQADNRIFKEFMGFVTTYPCNQGRIKGGATGAIAPGPPLEGGPP